MRYEDYQKEPKAEREHISVQSARSVTAKQVPVQEKQNILPYKEKTQNINLEVLQQNLGNCLQIIDDEVMKGYRSNLCNLPIIAFDNERALSLKDIHFFRVSELVYQEDEFSVYKLATMFHSLSNKPCTLVMMIKSDGLKNDFYLGVRSLDGRFSSGTMMQMLRQSLLGMFPGSQIDAYYDEELKKDMQNMKAGCISSVTCVADFKQENDDINNQEFVQGLEKFVDSMQGRAYTAVFIAENVSHNELMNMKREYENIYTQISPFTNMQYNFSSSDSSSLASGQSDSKTQSESYGSTRSVSNNISNGSTITTGTNESYGSTDMTGSNQSVALGQSKTDSVSDGVNSSESRSHTKGNFNSVGVNIGKKFKKYDVSAGVNASHGTSDSDTYGVSHGISHTVSKSDSISRTLTHGISDSHSDSITHGTSQGRSTSQTYGIGLQQGENRSKGESFSFVNSKTLTDTFGTSQGITLNAKNMTLVSIMQRLEKHLKRIEECESIGMWDFAAYFIAESAAETETAAGMYQSIVSGLQSGIEQVAVNTWVEKEKTEDISAYIKNFLHPCFLYEGFDYDGVRQEVVNPSVLVSTNELAIHMGLPRHSVKGLSVTEHAAFAQEVLKRNEGGKRREFELGNVYHLGNETETKVTLDVESMTMHTFVTGSTGSGKSNTIYEILNQLRNLYGIPFLVIEPAKGEYKNVFGQFADVSVYGTNPKKSMMLRINPFRFPHDVHVLEHLDRLVEIFNVCWPMYAAMPAILKEAMEKSYVAAGWDLSTSENKKGEIYPNFADLLEQIEYVINDSKYSADSKGDYSGALLTRVRSLTNGLNGLIFCNDDLEDKELFDKNVIVDLSRVGSTETKSLIMGILVMKLNEYRMDSGKINSPLNHITVLEEAHNLLKKTSTEQDSESANLLGKSVELLANSIAEMRTYGEGFIIADQSPGLLDMSVIRNTNTKIILRLPEKGDRELVGYAASLNDKQIQELSKLKRGVAAVYQGDWIEPVLVHVNRCEIEEMIFDYANHEKIVDKADLRMQLMNFLIQGRVNERLYYDIAEIEQNIDSFGFSICDTEFIKEQIAEYKVTDGILEIWKDENFANLSQRITDMLGVRTRIENCVLTAEDNESLTQMLLGIILQEIPHASESTVLALSQCFMRDMSTQQEESESREKIYLSWIQSVIERNTGYERKF